MDFQCVSSAPESAAWENLGMIVKTITLLLLLLFYNVGESYTLNCHFVILPFKMKSRSAPSASQVRICPGFALMQPISYASQVGLTWG